MRQMKGCLNTNCQEYRKTYYKESDQYCVKCGSKLSVICRHPKCFKQLPENTQESYCPVHLAEREDKKEKRIESAKKLGTSMVATVGSVCVLGKWVYDKVKQK